MSSSEDEFKPKAQTSNIEDKTTSMDILEKIIRCEVDVIYGPVMTEIYNKYSTAIENLTSICNTHPHFSYIISPNELNSLFHLRETEVANILEFAQPQPVLRILHVHSPSVVLKDTRTKWKMECPLLFYVSGLKCSQMDHVKVFFSTRTHGHMMRGSFGIGFSEKSTMVLANEHENPKFFLSSQAFQANFMEQTPNFLCVYKCVLAILDQSKLRDLTQRFSLGVKDSNKSEMYALKSIPALLHPEWPMKALNFMSRQRQSGWPSASLLQQVSAVGCHLIPAPNCGSNENQINEWQLNFYVAEKLLLHNLSFVDKQAAFIFSCLICDRYVLNQGVITTDHVRTIILWTLEEHPLPAEETKNPLLTRFMQICDKFMSVLSSGCCDHYFIPERNLFADIPMKVLKDIHDIVTCLLDQPWTLILHCYLLPYSFYDQKNTLESMFYSDNIKDDELVHDTLVKFEIWSANIKRQLVDQVRDSLLEAFNDTVLLYILTSCARMNGSSVDDSIILYKAILRHVQDASIENKLYLPFIHVVSINLGSLFHVKGLTSKATREKEYYLTKAESMMQEAKAMDTCLARTRLANLFYSLHQYPEAIHTLNELLQALDKQNLEEELSTPDGSDAGTDVTAAKMAPANLSVDFTELLWKKWCRKEFAFDIMYNRTLQPLCPPELVWSLSMTMCTTLGVKSHSVAIFSPIFHTRFLIALCYAGMSCPEQALPILHGLAAVLTDHKLVKTLETSHFSEVNEKRIAAYYIMLGNCYYLLKQKHFAKEAFCQAIEVYPTLHNPAGILYTGLVYGDKISGVQESLKALVATSVLSLAINYFVSQI